MEQEEGQEGQLSMGGGAGSKLGKLRRREHRAPGWASPDAAQTGPSCSVSPAGPCFFYEALMALMGPVGSRVSPVPAGGKTAVYAVTEDRWEKLSLDNRLGTRVNH